MKKSTTILILLLFICLAFSENIFAAQRSVRFTTESGNSVYLYNDYHALVIGIGEYNQWPSLPGAVKDLDEGLLPG